MLIGKRRGKGQIKGLSTDDLTMTGSPRDPVDVFENDLRLIVRGFVRHLPRCEAHVHRDGELLGVRVYRRRQPRAPANLPHSLDVAFFWEPASVQRFIESSTQVRLAAIERFIDRIPHLAEGAAVVFRLDFGTGAQRTLGSVKIFLPDL